MDKFEAEYRAKLTPAQFHNLREKGTEPPFSGRYYMTNENGIYHCAACHNPLFDSKHKFFSSCRWPATTCHSRLRVCGSRPVVGSSRM